MHRFHINISVADLEKSIEFYRTLFGEDPMIHKDDYAKWMLDDPRINFAISLSKGHRGINHIGLQADTLEQLGDIQERLRAADAIVFDQPDAHCCYARSTKTWVRDPDDVAWETFVTHEGTTQYGEDFAPAAGARPEPETRCCN